MSTNESFRIVFAGGGTGGHLYPGLALAQTLRAADPESQIAFLATARNIDRQILSGRPYQLEFIASRGFSMRPWEWPALALSMVSSAQQARRFLASFRPHAVVGLGGFGSYAAVRQAQKMGLPTFVLNPDLLVGRANRALIPGAAAVFCQFEETTRNLRTRGAALALGCPLRPDLFGLERRQAARKLGLDETRRTLLVTGASTGARTINEAFQLMPELLKQYGEWQVLHLTGREAYKEVRAAIAADYSRYYVRDYIDDMGLAYAVSDLVVGRAGAGTVAELTALGLPSVLMPYPYHRDRHQERHALALQESGAAVCVTDRLNAQMNCAALWQVISPLMRYEERRHEMAEAARKLGRPQAAVEILRAICSAIGRQPPTVAQPVTQDSQSSPPSPAAPSSTESQSVPRPEARQARAARLATVQESLFTEMPPAFATSASAATSPSQPTTAMRAAPVSDPELDTSTIAARS